MNATEPNTGRNRRRRLQKRRRLEGLDTVCQLLLVIIVVLSAAALGTVHDTTLLCIAGLAAVGGSCALMAARQLPVPALVLTAFGLVSAAQAIPLPAAIVGHLSPSTADAWLRCLVPFGEAPPGAFSLSMDPGASIADALKWFTYAAVYVMAHRVRVRRGSPWIATVLFISAVLVAAVTLVHGVADLRDVYGFYHPNFPVGRWNVGPFLNSNNLAGYAIIGLFAGGSLLISGRGVVPRSPLLLGMSVIATALCLSGSRAGLISALFGGTVVLVWFVAVQGSRLSLKRLALAVAPLTAAVIAAISLGTERDLGSVSNLDMRRKVAVWVWSLPMIRDHFWFGVGRGGFETALPPYRKAFDYDWTAVTSHAENFIVQWIAEWGVPFGVCAVVLVVGYIGRQWLANRGDRSRFVMLTGLVALLIQNLADLGLEIPGLAIAAIVALAAGELPLERPREEAKPRLATRAFLATAAFSALWVAAAVFSLEPVEAERRELSSAYRELPVRSADERAHFRARLRAATLRHPGEPFFPLLGAVVAYRAHDGNPMIWVSRALELGPTNGHVHLALAEFLGAHGAVEQAMLHLRLTASYDRTLGSTAGALAAQWAPSIDTLMRAIPDGAPGDEMLETACGKQAALDMKLDCYERATHRNPQDADVQRALAEQLLYALRANQWPCLGIQAETCIKEADSAIRKLAALQPRSWRPGYLLAGLMLQEGQLEPAARLLARVCPPSPDGIDCARDAVRAALKSGAEDAITAATTSFATRPCDSSASCAELLDWLGNALDGAGKRATALTYFTKAAEIDPSASRWLKVADRAVQGHLYGVARTAIARAEHSTDATPDSRVRAEQLKLLVAQNISAGPL